MNIIKYTLVLLLVLTADVVLAAGFAWINSLGHEGIGKDQMIYGLVMTVLMNAITTTAWAVSTGGW